MDLAPYVDRLQHELLVAAEAGGEEARALAERLVRPLESAARLVILATLSSAANEITRELAPGSVDIRLRGLDPEFVVTPPPPPEAVDNVAEGRPADAPGGAAPTVASEAATDEGGTARMTVRLPEQFKFRIEEAARRESLPVNTWLVRTLAAAMEPGDRQRRSGRRASSGEQHHTGWVH